MRIGIATVTTPPIHGGAEFLRDGLATALIEAGHQVHRLIMPFSYASTDACARAMDLWEKQDFMPYRGGSIDRVIALKFPAYLAKHPDMVAWLLHQHRPAYDLFGQHESFPAGDAAATALARRIRETDTRILSGLSGVYTIARRVSERLLDSCGVASRPIYHPPDSADRFRCAPSAGYVLIPSRLESLKRQDLALRALQSAHHSATAVIVGDGGERRRLEDLVSSLGLTDRVRFTGSVDRASLIELYARCAAVFFGPFDEDYGYVTLEAMLSSKPVITCRDSGGPLEFVVDGETGWVVEPTPEAIAAAFDEALSADGRHARQRGEAGRARYESMGVTWADVVTRLVDVRDRAP